MMKQMGVWTAALGAVLAITSVGCGDSTTIVELKVTETIPVIFGDMQSMVPESASSPLADLRAEPAYADALTQLECGALDITASKIVIEKLTVGTGATVLNYQVDVAASGSGQWVFLAEFDGSVVAGDEVNLDDNRVVVDPQGLEAIAAIVLSAAPAMDVQVTAESPGALDELQVALSLVLSFSSDSGGCPSVATGK
ncbi:MAG: hypothetical protein ACI9MR_004596 [Myxococcota bacterium]|jgi:hypothetical protein